MSIIERRSNRFRRFLRDVRDNGPGEIMKTRSGRVFVAAASALILWQLVAMMFFPERILPAPTQVVQRLLVIFDVGGPRGNSALYHLRISLVRVAIVTTIGMSIAIVLGILMGINDQVEDAFTTILPFWMTFPTVVVVLVTMIMFNFSQMSVITAVVFAATPYAAVNTWEGTQNVDTGLIEMASAFKASQVAVWRHIYIPSIMPSIFGSLRYLLSMVWKIVVLSEVFGIENGMGAMFRFWYNESDITALLAYLVLFVGVMFILEYGIIYPLEKYIFRWRE